MRRRGRRIGAWWFGCIVLGASLACRAGAAPDAAAGSHRAQTLVVMAPDARLAEAVRRALAGHDLGRIRFAVVDATGTTPLARLETASAKGAAAPDLVLMTASDVAIACAENLLAAPAGARNCGTPALDDGLAFVRDRAREASVAELGDYWDVVRHPGRRGLPLDARGTLEIALLADGVAPRDVYPTLGSGAGADRAFRKLDQLRPYVAWWSDAAEARRALESGAVLMTVLPLEAVAPADATAGAALRTEPVLGDTLGWAVPAGSGDVAAATDALATVAVPGLAAAIAARVPPLAPDAGSGAPPPGAAPPAPLRLDAAFWRDHAALRARFRAWLAS